MPYLLSNTNSLIYTVFFFVTSVDSIQYATGIVDPYSVQDVCTVMNIVYGLALHQSLHRSVDR